MQLTVHAAARVDGSAATPFDRLQATPWGQPPAAPIDAGGNEDSSSSQAPALPFGPFFPVDLPATAAVAAGAAGSALTVALLCALMLLAPRTGRLGRPGPRSSCGRIPAFLSQNAPAKPAAAVEAASRRATAALSGSRSDTEKGVPTMKRCIAAMAASSSRWVRALQPPTPGSNFPARKRPRASTRRAPRSARVPASSTMARAARAPAAPGRRGGDTSRRLGRPRRSGTARRQALAPVSSMVTTAARATPAPAMAVSRAAATSPRTRSAPCRLAESKWTWTSKQKSSTRP